MRPSRFLITMMKGTAPSMSITENSISVTEKISLMFSMSLTKFAQSYDKKAGWLQGFPTHKSWLSGIDEGGAWSYSMKIWNAAFLFLMKRRPPHSAPVARINSCRSDIPAPWAIQETPEEFSFYKNSSNNKAGLRRSLLISTNLAETSDQNGFWYRWLLRSHVCSSRKYYT